MAKQSTLFDDDLIDCNTGNDKPEVHANPGSLTKPYSVSKAKGILSLDIASNTGFCTATASGVWHLTPKKDESKGMRLIRFRAKLKEVCALEEIRIVVFEQVATYGKFPNHTASEMIGVLKLFCEENGIEYRSYPPTVIKKAATGKGNAKKEAMIEAAKQYKTSVTSDDEADAILLYQLAIKDLEL